LQNAQFGGYPASVVTGSAVHRGDIGLVDDMAVNKAGSIELRCLGKSKRPIVAE